MTFFQWVSRDFQLGRIWHHGWLCSQTEMVDTEDLLDAANVEGNAIVAWNMEENM